MKRSSKTDKQQNTTHGLNIVFEDTYYGEGRDFIISDFINWQPLYDLYIDSNEVVITIEIAGVDIKDFSIYTGRHYMIIDGVRRSPSVFDKNNCIFHNLEIPYGIFYKKIDFPAPIEPKKYQYKLENGVLTIRFPVVKERIIPIVEE